MRKKLLKDQVELLKPNIHVRVDRLQIRRTMQFPEQRKKNKKELCDSVILGVVYARACIYIYIYLCHKLASISKIKKDSYENLNFACSIR